jgi:hypothetical protein
MNINYEVILLITNTIFLASILLVCILYARRNIPNELFLITLKSLNQIITAYNDHILVPRIAALKKNHDLDPKSQTNSAKVFEIEKDRLIKDAAQEIFKNYLNSSSYKILSKFYTDDGLILFIVTYFRGH